VLSRLQAAGCEAFDDGDVAIPSYVPHHHVPPIRNWPGPRIAWDCVSERIAPYLQQPGRVPLLVGCDCSIVVGSTQALARASPGGVHVLYVDGDLDAAAPEPWRSHHSAAALAVWLLTHSSPFWAGHRSSHRR
jgi:arginase